MTEASATDINATTLSHNNPSLKSFPIMGIIVQKPVHPPASRYAQRVPLRKAKRGKPNLPFAPRRGRVRSTQGMLEIEL